MATRLRYVGTMLVIMLLPTACMMPMGGWVGRRALRQYESNGEQIFATGTSQAGRPITFDMGNRASMGHMGMMGGTTGCANCHGSDGRGGEVQMMMTRFVAPDIRYSTLTAGEHGHEEIAGRDEEEHPPYTDETIARAITQGINPAGDPLVWPMPRWSMSQQDLSDLLVYLKTLD